MPNNEGEENFARSKKILKIHKKYHKYKNKIVTKILSYIRIMVHRKIMTEPAVLKM